MSETQYLAQFDTGIDATPKVEQDYWDRTMVTIKLPDGITLAFRASEIAATMAPASYERALAMYRADFERGLVK